MLVVGAGISGAACAAALRAAGLAVEVRERGRVPGGRMASPTLHGRRVDLGAAYFTVRDDAFAAVVADWQRRELVRPWSQVVEAFDATGRHRKQGPQRWAAPDGLRSLVRDLHEEVVQGAGLAELPDGYDATVLAMPDPQAARLAPALTDWVDYDPVIAVAGEWAARTWSLDAAFVNDDPDITLVADDGARRGDGAPVLVVHTTPARARAHLAAPEDAIGPALAAAGRLLDLGVAPRWTHAHRWTYAKPVTTHGAAPYLLVAGARGPLGVCGDSWCPAGAPRVEAAWLSGHRLGTELGRRLT